MNPTDGSENILTIIDNLNEKQVETSAYYSQRNRSEYIKYKLRV